MKGLSTARKFLQDLKRKYGQDNLEYEFLPPALEIEETPPSPAKRILIWIILALLIGAFLWSYFGRVDEVAMARGKIIPGGRIKMIQPLATGVIRAIYISEGQLVKKGQILIEMDPTIDEADVESTSEDLAIQLAGKQRLIEELTGKRSAPPKIHDEQAVPPQVLALERQLIDTKKAEYEAKEEAQQAVIEQRKDALQSAEATLEQYLKTRGILRQEASAYNAAYKADYISKMEHLEKQKELFTAEQEYLAQIKEVSKARESLLEAKQTLVALKRDREKDILGDIVNSENKIITYQDDMTKARQRFKLERLVSPVSGTVQGLQVHTIGGVVTPAQTLASIVPKGTPLVVEATVENKDIGFVKSGQQAKIKLDTFPFQRYGVIKGVVKQVSPDAFEDKKKGPVYKIKVSMEKTNILVDGKLVPLEPGMSCSVEIKTGKRRIIGFFLSPIMKYAKESLTLR